MESSKVILLEVKMRKFWEEVGLVKGSKVMRMYWHFFCVVISFGVRTSLSLSAPGHVTPAADL